MSRALLFAVPGTSSAQAAEAFRNIDRLTQARFPDIPRSWTYTSGGVRRKLAAHGTTVEPPAQALSRLRRQGVKRLAVQSLHLVDGMEYGELRETIVSFNAGPDGFERCALGQPILETPDLFAGIVHELLREISPPPRGDGDTAALLVAHGSRQPSARKAYEVAAAYCRGMETRVMLGTIMEPLGLPSVISRCRDAGIKRVFLMPFTIAAGSSVIKDLAGPDPDSWRSLLAGEGIECMPVLRGLGEYDAIARLWVEEAGKLLEKIQ